VSGSELSLGDIGGALWLGTTVSEGHKGPDLAACDCGGGICFNQALPCKRRGQR
jgi:hypothetical protein